jgi:hypothetical protein
MEIEKIYRDEAMAPLAGIPAECLPVGCRLPTVCLLFAIPWRLKRLN